MGEGEGVKEREEALEEDRDVDGDGEGSEGKYHDLPEVDSDYEHDHIPSLRVPKLARSDTQKAHKEKKGRKEKEKEKEKYDVMKLKAKTREGEHYGEVFIAFSDEEEMPLRALYLW